jgi:hypothetical protein
MAVFRMRIQLGLWIRIQLGLWIRIQEGKNDPLKKITVKKFQVKVLFVLFGGLETSLVA